MIDKDSLPLDRPRRTPDHPTKSHVVKTKVDGKERIIRFGEQGAETAGKPRAGESERMKAKRASFKARHAKNIAKGKSSPAYWADKVKWAEGGAVGLRKPASPSDVITDLMGKVKRGQSIREQEEQQLESMRRLLSSRRLGSARRSPLTELRSTDPTTSISSSPPPESVEPSAGAGTPQPAQVVQPVSSAALNKPAADNPYYAEAVRLAEKYNLPAGVFVSLVNQESRFNPEARSPKGAIGLGQLMPGTAKELGVDPTDPLQNLDGAARYLRQQLDRFGSVPLALAAYNAGPGNVRKHGGIPPFKETQNYVAQVMKGAGGEQPGYAGGGAVRRLIDTLGSKVAKETAEKAAAVPEQKMLQGFYRGYAGDYDAARAAEDAGAVFASPQKPVGEYYGRKRAAQTGEEPHLEMLLADPFAGKKYGHAVPMGPMNRSGVGQTMAREFNPEEIETITRLFNEGGYVSGYARGGEVEAEIKATPQNPVLGGLARGVKSVQELASKYSLPEAIPLVGGMGVDELLGLPGAARETERWSYGNYPLRVNPYAGRTSSYLPETKPGRQADLADTVMLGADVVPLTSLATKYGTRGALAAGKQLEGIAERAVPQIMERGGAGAEALLGLSGGTRSQVIKPKGGNWLQGSTDAFVDPLKQTTLNDERYARMATENTPEEVMQIRAIHDPRRALNTWLDTKLRKYIQNEMGTPEDPVRKLADEGKLHFEPEPRTPSDLGFLYRVRQEAGAPAESLAKTDLGAGWEERADFAINAMPAERYYRYDNSVLDKNPWLAKIPPETPTYSMIERAETLGFDHLVDEMRNAMRPDTDLPARLRIDPDKLEKMTVPQIVEKVSQINAWRAEQQAAANAAKAMNPATQVFKEYPEQGYRWVELKLGGEAQDVSDMIIQNNGKYSVLEPGEKLSWKDPETGRVLFDTPEAAAKAYNRDKGVKSLADALKYEGDVMGHCVGGYCPDVAEGRSRIFSLRDSKGEPHVTVEVQPGKREGERAVDYRQLTPENYARKYGDDSDLTERIVQIKGKANRAPKEEYLPFVQDFVKSQNWSDVGDIQNTGLMKYQGRYISPAELEYKSEEGWRNLAEVAREAFPNSPERQSNFIRGAASIGDDYVRPVQPQGYAAGGLVSAYNPEAVDAMVNQILEGAYV